MKTIHPRPEKDEQSAPTVADALTRVLARMLAEERVKQEFRRRRPETASKQRGIKPDRIGG